MQTPFQITFKALPVSEFLETAVRRRAARLDRLRHDIIFCRVVIEAANHRSEPKPPVGISIEVEVPKRTIVARETVQQHQAKQDVLAVINRAFDAVERQLEDDIHIKRSRAQIAQRGHRDGNGRSGVTSQND